jgi:hypothetical protein
MARDSHKGRSPKGAKPRKLPPLIRPAHATVHPDFGKEGESDNSAISRAHDQAKQVRRQLKHKEEQLKYEEEGDLKRDAEEKKRVEEAIELEQAEAAEQAKARQVLCHSSPESGQSVMLSGLRRFLALGTT